MLVDLGARFTSRGLTSPIAVLTDDRRVDPPLDEYESCYLPTRTSSNLFLFHFLPMFGMERDLDSDMLRVWHLVQELSEQLAHNQKLVSTLQAHANTLKVSYASLLSRKLGINSNQTRTMRYKMDRDAL